MYSPTFDLFIKTWPNSVTFNAILFFFTVFPITEIIRAPRYIVWYAKIIHSQPFVFTLSRGVQALISPISQS